jgi:hypothetical protein
MVKTGYPIAFILYFVALNCSGQFNRNLKQVEQPDTIETQFEAQSQMNFKPAEFPGGMASFYKYISKKMRVPKELENQNIRGKVFVEFVIDSVGNIKKESVKVKQSLLPSCDNEAVRLIVNCPRWIPAVDLKTNKNVATIYTLPILFLSK